MYAFVCRGPNGILCHFITFPSVFFNLTSLYTIGYIEKSTKQIAPFLFAKISLFFVNVLKVSFFPPRQKQIKRLEYRMNLSISLHTVQLSTVRVFFKPILVVSRANQAFTC